MPSCRTCRQLGAVPAGPAMSLSEPAALRPQGSQATGQLPGTLDCHLLCSWFQSRLPSLDLDRPLPAGELSSVAVAPVPTAAELRSQDASCNTGLGFVENVLRPQAMHHKPRDHIAQQGPLQTSSCTCLSWPMAAKQRPAPEQAQILMSAGQHAPASTTAWNSGRAASKHPSSSCCFPDCKLSCVCVA